MPLFSLDFHSATQYNIDIFMKGVHDMHLPSSIFSGYHGACHCQGIAVDLAGGYIYYSFTTKLVKTDLAGRLIGSVEGLIGHLGCIDFCQADRRVYGSLEYKNDVIGRGILQNLDMADKQISNAFYCAIFDVDCIDRMNMPAEAVMRAVYLPEVVADYEASVEIDGRVLSHKYACSGIDGTAWGPDFGACDGKQYLNICYGVYGDVGRADNDYQIILQFDAANWWDTVAQPLRQDDMHQSGAYSVGKHFLYTGNTNWGVQNLEYDAYSGNWLAAVYPGKKPQFENYSMFVIDGTRAPKVSEHDTYGEQISVLHLCGQSRFPHGSTGICALGDGKYYFSEAGRDPERGQYTNVTLWRATRDADAIFERIEE